MTASLAIAANEAIASIRTINGIFADRMKIDAAMDTLLGDLRLIASIRIGRFSIAFTATILAAFFRRDEIAGASFALARIGNHRNQA